jgi:hypothetical protein
MNYQNAMEMAPQFEVRIAELAEKFSDTPLHAGVYQATLRYLLKNRIPGACHLFAAVLYVLFVEAEEVVLSTVAADDLDDDDVVEYRMCVGVARSPELERFDHSWVEAGPLVYDVAVCLPLEDGAPTGGPVFASHDLLTEQWVHGAYRQHDTDSLDSIADDVARWSLAEYGEEIWKRDKRQLWEIIADIGSEVGFNFDPSYLATRHGATYRVRAQSMNNPESSTE